MILFAFSPIYPDRVELGVALFLLILALLLTPDVENHTLKISLYLFAQ